MNINDMRNEFRTWFRRESSKQYEILKNQLLVGEHEQTAYDQIFALEDGAYKIFAVECAFQAFCSLNEKFAKIAESNERYSKFFFQQEMNRREEKKQRDAQEYRLAPTETDQAKQPEDDIKSVRLKFWMDAWIAVAGSNSCVKPTTPAVYADQALIDFDARRYEKTEAL